MLVADARQRILLVRGEVIGSRAVEGRDVNL
jgi:hypothetical protein